MSEDVKPAPRKRHFAAPLLEIGPLVLFFIANGKWDIFVGTTVFVVATAIVLPFYRWLEGRWPIMPLVGGFFVVVFGGLTLWLQDATFIKLKPTIVNCLFGVILGGGLLFGRPLLKPIVNEIAWRGFSTETWIASKLFVSFPLTMIFALLQIGLLRRNWDGPDNPFAKES